MRSKEEVWYLPDLSRGSSPRPSSPFFLLLMKCQIKLTLSLSNRSQTFELCAIVDELWLWFKRRGCPPSLSPRWISLHCYWFVCISGALNHYKMGLFSRRDSRIILSVVAIRCSSIILQRLRRTRRRARQPSRKVTRRWWQVNMTKPSNSTPMPWTATRATCGMLLICSSSSSTSSNLLLPMPSVALSLHFCCLSFPCSDFNFMKGVLQTSDCEALVKPGLCCYQVRSHHIRFSPFPHSCLYKSIHIEIFYADRYLSICE